MNLKINPIIPNPNSTPNQNNFLSLKDSNLTSLLQSFPILLNPILLNLKFLSLFLIYPPYEW